MTYAGVLAFAPPMFLGLLMGLLLFWGIYKLGPFAVAKQSPVRPAFPRMLFRAGILVDANPSALVLFPGGTKGNVTWEDLANRMSARFPGFPPSHGTTHSLMIQKLEPIAPQDLGRAVIEQWEEFSRVTIEDKNNASGPTVPGEIPARFNDIARAVSDAPHPIWQTDVEGRIEWANNSYHQLARREGHHGVEGEPAILFEPPATGSERAKQRLPLHLSDDSAPRWFDVETITTRNALLHYATESSAIVQAEVAQRNFVQTLTKTFAQLSIGLAIFDRNRQLALFNPALTDLTTLPADFLSGRPNLLNFFDRLRENRIIPEPKNYSSWREQIAELVMAAADGRYTETWTLPSGLTYRVSGRPHPDGAIALLFEDISAEISLTRRFRADLETGQSVLDALPVGVVVFSAHGHVTMSNRLFRELWDTDPDAHLAEYTLRNALESFRAMSRQTPIWDQLSTHVMNPKKERKEWTGNVTLHNGTRLLMRVVSIGGGATMVQFDVSPKSEEMETAAQ